MGIPKLGEWLKTQNIKLNPNDPYDERHGGKRYDDRKGRDTKRGLAPDFSTEGMLIDMNDLLHYAAQKTWQYDDFKDFPPIGPKVLDVELEIKYCRELTNILETYLDEFEPKQYFIVAIDGAVPLGKIFEQRKRRFATGGEMTTERWSSMYLTPGTAFSSKINVHLREWFESYPKLPKFSMYSGYQIPGEGEHKMFKYLKEALKTGDIVEGTGLHIYTGQDGDLLMIGSLVNVKNLIWLKQYRTVEGFTNLPNSITAFRNRIDSTFGRGRMNDFIVMMFMYGNDFIPHHPALTGPSISVVTFSEAYKEMKLPLVNADNKIDRKSLEVFFNIMADKELMLLEEQARNYRSLENEFDLITQNIRVDARKRVIDFDFFQFRLDWYTRVLEQYHPEKLSTGDLESHIDDLVQKMTSNYIDMLQWNLDYYRGETPNISWERAYPYAFAPLFHDLAMSKSSIANSIDSVDADGTSSSDITGASIIRQLLMVIHPKILPKLVPKDYAKLVTDPDPKIGVLSKFSPQTPVWFADGRPLKEKLHLWYSVLPIVNISEYDEAIAELKAKGKGDIPDYMNLKTQPLIRRTNFVGEVSIIRATPKPNAEDSKYVWVKRQLM